MMIVRGYVAILSHIVATKEQPVPTASDVLT